MKTKNKWRLRIVLLAFVAWVAWLGTLWGGPITGVVLDEAGNVPVVGALVVVSWQAHTFHSHFCQQAALAKTGPDGRFRVPLWVNRWRVENIAISVDRVSWFAYQPGFVEASPTGPLKPDLTLLKRASNSTRERLDYLRHVAGVVLECGDWDRSKEHLMPPLEAVQHEAEVLAGSTPEHKDFFRWLSWVKKRATGSNDTFDDPYSRP
jgi:hypothetical protein